MNEIIILIIMGEINMSTNLNDIIDDHGLTLSVGTVIKVVTLFDKIIPKCFYKGTPDYVQAEKCKFCKEFQIKMNSSDVLCRKHYAPKLHNDSNTNLSQLVYRGEVFTLFGRYAMRTTPACTYAFYITPMHIDLNRFCVYVYPNEIFRDRKPKYVWSAFKKPDILSFSIDLKKYTIDTSDKYHITIKEF
jgi:hypothetical protein